MKKHEFKFLQYYCDNKNDNTLILIIEENQNSEFEFPGKYVRHYTTIYKVVHDYIVTDNILMLICHKESQLKMCDFDYVIKYDVELLDKYFTDDILETKEKE